MFNKLFMLFLKFRIKKRTLAGYSRFPVLCVEREQYMGAKGRGGTDHTVHLLAQSASIASPWLGAQIENKYCTNNLNHNAIK